jgi:hypothetical protein
MNLKSHKAHLQQVGKNKIRKFFSCPVLYEPKLKQATGAPATSRKKILGLH